MCDIKNAQTAEKFSTNMFLIEYFLRHHIHEAHKAAIINLETSQTRATLKAQGGRSSQPTREMTAILVPAAGGHAVHETCVVAYAWSVSSDQLGCNF